MVIYVIPHDNFTLEVPIQMVGIINIISSVEPMRDIARKELIISNLSVTSHERHGVPNHCARLTSRKKSKVHITGHVGDITGGFPSQRASNAESISILYDVTIKNRRNILKPSNSSFTNMLQYFIAFWNLSIGCSGLQKFHSLSNGQSDFIRLSIW